MRYGTRIDAENRGLKAAPRMVVLGIAGGAIVPFLRLLAVFVLLLLPGTVALSGAYALLLLLPVCLVELAVRFLPRGGDLVIDFAEEGGAFGGRVS